MNWSFPASYLWHLAILGCLAILFTTWMHWRTRSLIRRWAAQHQYKLLKVRWRWGVLAGPFYRQTLNVHRNNLVYLLTIRDQEGRERRCWFCCNSLWGKNIQTLWEDELTPAQKADSPKSLLVFYATALIVGGTLVFVLAKVKQEPAPLERHDSVEEVKNRSDTFAAIAYSPATGRYGYADECRSRASAEEEARRKCHGEDARIVTWVHNGFCALAIDTDGVWAVGWSDGEDANASAAKEKALADSRKRGSNVRLQICVCSFGRKTEVIE